MNPHASTKCAGRLLMALAAIASILLAAGCGNSNSLPTLNNEGFSNSDLSGTYVISISGTDVNNSNYVVPFAIVGTITTDGKGNITGGTVDINDPYNTGVNLGQTVSGTYNVTQDGRGTGTLSTISAGSFGIDFVLTSNGHGLITRFDNVGTGSGTIDVQGSATQSSLGSFAFSLSGSDSIGNSLATVGGFTLNSSNGAITSGLQDFNDNGSSPDGYTNLTLTGSVVVPSGTSGTATLTTSNTTISSNGSLNFDVWVIDSTHLKFIETDTATTGVALAGDAFMENFSITTVGQMVFTLGGLDSTLQNPVVAGGYGNTDDNFDISSGLEDYNDAGTVGLGQAFSGSGTCVASAGRCQTTLTGFTNGTAQSFTFAAYPFSGGYQLLEIDSHGLLQGSGYFPTAISFTAPAGYGLNLSGANLDLSSGFWYEVDDIAQFDAGSPGTSTTTTPNMTGVLDENSILGGPQPTSSLSGIYIPDPTADGRGSISATNSNTLLGGFNLQYYVVDSSTVVFIEIDQQQVAMGTFEAQSSSSFQAAARPAISMVRPVVRPHAALRRK